MPTDIHQFRGQNSEGTIVGWKRFVELCHFPANSGEPFNKMYLEPHFGKIKGGLHARNASANYKDIPIHERDLLRRWVSLEKLCPTCAGASFDMVQKKRIQVFYFKSNVGILLSAREVHSALGACGNQGRSPGADSFLEALDLYGLRAVGTLNPDARTAARRIFAVHSHFVQPHSGN